MKANSKAHSELRESQSAFASVITGVPDDVDTFEIILKRRKTKKNFAEGFKAFFSPKEIESFVVNNRDDIKKFTVSQGGIKSDEIDLLSDKLVRKQTFAQTRGRRIDSEEMYTSIIHFFNTTVVQQCEKV